VIIYREVTAVWL